MSKYKTPYRFKQNANRSKYHNVKTPVDGHVFDSKHEAERYMQLKMLLKRGEISDLVLQKEFILIPAQYAPDTIDENGKKVKGKCIERKCSYFADFVYFDNYTQDFVVEDAKGEKTDVYKIKKKLMLERYNIKIKEV